MSAMGGFNDATYDQVELSLGYLVTMEISSIPSEFHA